MTAGAPAVVAKKKLIEVALPLDAINAASKREKSIRHGHPSTLHLWWARRPLAAARAVIFAQMVDDPSANPDLFPTERAQERERKRLFGIIEELVKWESTTNETVLAKAREEIWQSWRRACAENADHPQATELFNRNVLPAFHDPFAGGGSLPLEAQRLGLEAHASDLNPVAVLINKAMIEIPPNFAGNPPVNPGSRAGQAALDVGWRGAQGLAEDVRYYGQWVRDEAEKRIGHLYPKVRVTEEMAEDRPDLEPYVGRELTVIAWLWARTVKSPNPAFSHVDVPLASTFVLSKKKGREAFVEPVIEDGGYRFAVKVGTPPEKAVRGTKQSQGYFRCLFSDEPIPYAYIDNKAKQGRMGQRLMAIVAEGDRTRVYLPPSDEAERAAQSADPDWQPDLPSRGTWGSNAQGRRYGFYTYGDYFTPRQLVALNTFSDLVTETQKRVRQDAESVGLSKEGVRLSDDGTGASAYAEAVGLYLALAISKSTNIGSSVATWMSDRGAFRETFARQAVPMAWDYAEANPLGDAGGGLGTVLGKGEMVLGALPAVGDGGASQADAAKQQLAQGRVVSTDPPYYGNVAYAVTRPPEMRPPLMRVLWPAKVGGGGHHGETTQAHA